MARLVEFAQNNLFLVLALLATWSAVMFYEIKLKSRGLYQVSSADALRIVNKGAMIIDVRPAEAFGNGHIVNARNIALEALQSDRPPLKRKNKVLLTVCENGIDSGKAASSLRKGGLRQCLQPEGRPDAMARGEPSTGQMSLPDPSASHVIVFSSPFCGYCAAAKRLLMNKNADFIEINILNSPERRKEMIELSGRRSVPQIFVGGQHIGGYTELSALEATGELDALLADGR